MKVYRLFASLLLSFSISSCAGRTPLPKHLRVEGVPELAQRMEAARVPLQTYTAEVRLTYFGEQGRARGTAIIAVKRPSFLRYELQGPHGGVISAFAMNGRELAFFDLADSRFFHGPATAENIDELLGIAPLALGPEQWVALLFGEVAVPEDAALRYDESSGRFVLTWRQKGQTRQVGVDPESARVERVAVFDGDELVSEVRVDERGERGIPAALHLAVATAETEVEIRLRDVEHGVPLEDDVFQLTPPSGVVPEYLGSAE